jgi:hypothetical protein
MPNYKFHGIEFQPIWNYSEIITNFKLRQKPHCTMIIGVLRLYKIYTKSLQEVFVEGSVSPTSHNIETT